MKLQNKKTGQLGNFIINKDHFECVDLDYVPEYNSIAELNKDWEDYEDDDTTVFDYWERSGIKSELLGTIIAPENYVAPNGKQYFTYDEAMKLEEEVLKPNGWRLPTYKESLLLCAEFGINEYSGLDDADKFEKTLNMEKIGWIDREDIDKYNENPKDSNGLVCRSGMEGYWWSSSTTSGIDVRYLYASGSRLLPRGNYDRDYGFPVRCVKIKEDS